MFPLKNLARKGLKSDLCSPYLFLIFALYFVNPYHSEFISEIIIFFAFSTIVFSNTEMMEPLEIIPRWEQAPIYPSCIVNTMADNDLVMKSIRWKTPLLIFFPEQEEIYHNHTKCCYCIYLPFIS